MILRIASAVYQGSSIKPLPGVTDQISYHELAIRVVDGHGFSFGTAWWPATKANEPTAHWSYLYVLFLATVYSILGPAPLAARLMQAVIVGVLHPLLMWRIGNRLFNPTVGLVSAAITSVYGYFVYYGGALVTESFYIVAFLWALDVATALVYAHRNGQPAGHAPWALLGLAFGATALLRQAFLLMVPFVLLWIAWHLVSQRRARGHQPVAPLSLAARMALTMAVLLGCILPWTVRNYKSFGEFVLLNTNAGYVFYWGNHPVHGTEFRPIMSTVELNYMTLLPGDLRGLNEARLDKALLARGIGFVKDDPVRYARLSLNRAKEYFKFWPSSDSGLLSNAVRVFSFGLCIPFLVLGVLLTLAGHTLDDQQDRSGAALLLLIAAMYSLVHLLTWTLVRYRLPVDALMMPFAALSAVVLFQKAFSMVPAGGSLRSSAS